MNTYLTLLLLIVVGGGTAAFCFWRADRHRWSNRPATASAPIPVARHRALPDRVKVEKDHTPLGAWERLAIAPTFNNPDVFVPAGPSEETRGLVAPRRRALPAKAAVPAVDALGSGQVESWPICAGAAGCRVHPDEIDLHDLSDAEVTR